MDRKGEKKDGSEMEGLPDSLQTGEPDGGTEAGGQKGSGDGKMNGRARHN